MGSYCCIKTISTQKESSIRIEELSKGISNLNNKISEYIPITKKNIKFKKNQKKKN